MAERFIPGHGYFQFDYVPPVKMVDTATPEWKAHEGQHWTGTHAGVRISLITWGRSDPWSLSINGIDQPEIPWACLTAEKIPEFAARTLAAWFHDQADLMY